jgi:hypothetical protein
MSFLNSKLLRVAAGVAVVSAIAAAPASAQDTPAAGTLAAGDLVVTAPAITAFNFELTGVTATVSTPVAGYTISDATGSNAGYSVTVAATAPTVDGAAAAAGTGSTLTLAPGAATAAAGNPAADGPVAAGAPVLLSAVAATVQNAPATTGQGAWDVSGGATALAVVIPGDASEGAYLSTLTFTTAAPAA